MRAFGSQFGSHFLGKSSPSVEETKHHIQDGLRRVQACGSSEEAGILTVEAEEGGRLQLNGGEELLSATYGASGAAEAADVLGRISSDLSAGKAIAVSNSVMGADPKPGATKTLSVQYRPSSKPMSVTVAEGKDLHLPPTDGIVSATYGHEETRIDVRTRLEEELMGAKGGAIKVQNERLGGDPAPGKGKSLVVEYLPRQELVFKLPYDGKVATFECIAPRLFHSLRKTIGVEADAFFASLTGADLLGGEKQVSGKSGEIFWFSADGRYVLKTIQDPEVNTLVRMLPEYTKYLAECPNALLTRYLGVFRLTDSGTATQIVVMNNVFEGSQKLDVMYDLKGTTEDRWVEPGDGRCLKDNNFAQSTIFIPDETSQMFHRQVQSDTRFLEKQSIMDYSLMLGISYQPRGDSTAARRFGQLIGGLQGMEARNVDDPVKCELYIGMVDMLVTYGWKKVAAHTVKAITVGLHNEIDTEPPDRYASRFRVHFGRKVRGLSEYLAITKVPAEFFELPLPALGRSGGTAAFFKVLYREGIAAVEAKQSRSYWIGKDLARAADEVMFYEAAKGLAGKQEWELLRWMTPYMGVCRAPCEVKAGEEPRPLDVMLLRNGRDGFKTCRMLDIKIGQVTAVGGWQGKSAFSAFMQANTIDSWTNSAGEGFRLEGFDNPPEVVRSVESIVTDGIVSTMGTNKAKFKRFNLQRMSASLFLTHFLDLHDSSGSTYAATPEGREAPAAAQAGPASLAVVETQELVLLSCIEELAAFVRACRTAPAPQMWIGSSVMLCFDCAGLPPREVLARGPRAWGVSRVQVFDWGRSELNLPAMHERLGPDEQAERRKYWSYYCSAVAKLLYDCCGLYLNRFCRPKRSFVMTLWDKDQFTPDDFIGTCVLPMAPTDAAHAVKTMQGGAVKAGMLNRGETAVTVSVQESPLPADSRLTQRWVVKVKKADNVPRMDVASPSDSFVTLGTASEDAAGYTAAMKDEPRVRELLASSAHLTTVAKDTSSPVWEEAFEFATLQDGARAPFLQALATAFGAEVPSTVLDALFPVGCRASAAAKPEELQRQFVQRCFPGMDL